MLFRGSSAVERSPVKRLVVGSIPTHGAKRLKSERVFLFVMFVTIIVMEDILSSKPIDL